MGQPLKIPQRVNEVTQQPVVDVADDLKNFVGFDDDGNPVLGADGEFRAVDKNEFDDLTNRARAKFGDKKFSDYYEDYNTNNMTKNNDFLGFDDNKKAVFRNKEGTVERTDNSMLTNSLKRQYGDAAFDKQSLGQNANQVAGENLATGDDIFRSGVNADTTKNRKGLDQLSRVMLQPTTQPQQTIQDTTQSPKQTIRQQQVAQQKTNKAKKQQPVQQPPTLTQQLTGVAQATASQAVDQQKQQAQQEANNQVNQASQPYRDQAQQQATGLENQAKDKATDYLKEQGLAGIGLSDEAKDSIGAAKNGLGTAKDTYNMAQQALNFAKDPLGQAQAMATDYAKQQANAAITDQLGFNPLDYKNLTSTQGMQDAAKQQALNSATDALSNQLGVSGISANDVGNLTNNFGKSSTATGDVAGRMAAKAALAGATGGLSTVVNPETLAAASALQDKYANKLQGHGAVGNAGADVLKLGSADTKAASDIGNAGMNLAGGVGSDLFKSGSMTLTGAKDAAKKLTSGDIAGGLGGLASTGLKAVLNNVYQAPQQVAKRAAEAAKASAAALANAAKAALDFINPFCFTAETPILMADGKYKKIKDIKLGDKVMLGGEVTAIGTSKNTDLWKYDNVTVTGGHAVFEDGKWIRVCQSKKGIKFENAKETLVFPMSTENHLIVTQNNIWADMEEVSSTFNKTDDDIIIELNKQQQANIMLRLWKLQYKWKK